MSGLPAKQKNGALALFLKIVRPIRGSQASITHNVFANYIAQVYVGGIGFVMAPIYLSYMGREAYGLIGFFSMMTAWFQLLDIGLTPTVTRETARYRGGATGINQLRSLLRALEVIFGGASVVGAAAIVFSSSLIATQWLKVQHEPVDVVARAIMLMGLAVPLRWVSSLYKGVINGFERQIWLGGFNIFVATARFAGVLLVFVVFGTSAVDFFAYQLVVAAIELIGLVAMTYRLVRLGSTPREKFSWKPLRGNLMLSLTIAFAATVWVVMTQTDKLILSKVLSLSDYGIFSIAIVASGVVYTIGAPINQALLPRLTKLVAMGNSKRVDELYSQSTQAICVLGTPAVALLAFFAYPILLAWTGKPDVAHGAAPILVLYAIGNGWVLLSNFSYYIQYAKGDLFLQFIGQALMVAALVPLFIWSANHFGGIGTGVAWAAVNGIYALVWIPVVHARVRKGTHWHWFFHDVVPIVVPTFLAGWVLSLVVHWPGGRIPTFIVAGLIGVALVGVATGGSSVLRQKLKRAVFS